MISSDVMGPQCWVRDSTRVSMRFRASSLVTGSPVFSDAVCRVLNALVVMLTGTPSGLLRRDCHCCTNFIAVTREIGLDGAFVCPNVLAILPNDIACCRISQARLDLSNQNLSFRCISAFPCCQEYVPILGVIINQYCLVENGHQRKVVTCVAVWIPSSFIWRK